MDANLRLELLRQVRQVMAHVEQILIAPDERPICERCGKELGCVHCMGRKGGKKLRQMYRKQQRRDWGKKGGRPRTREVTVDQVTGVAVPSAGVVPNDPKSKPSAPETYLEIDPAKFYKPADAGLLLNMNLETMRHWRANNRGPSYRKFGQRVRYLGKDLLDWLEKTRRAS